MKKYAKVSHNEQTPDKVYGPSWFDVYAMLLDIRRDYPETEGRLLLTTNRGIDGSAGLRFDFIDQMGTILGAGAFLGKSAQLHKTAAGAAFYSVHRAFERLEKYQEEGDPRIKKP